MATREAELYKDKVEVSLDGRQIFYLFFGGSVIVGMVFVLGVLVGRRVEARGHVDRARTHAVSDPLAALDRLEGSGGLSFQGALTGKDAPSSVEKTIDDLEKARAPKAAPTDKAVDKAKPEEAKAGPVVKPEPAAKPANKTEVKAENKPEPKIDAKPDAKVDAKSEKKPEAKIEKKSEPKVGAPEAKASAKVDAKVVVKVDAKVGAKVDAPVEKKPEESKTRYTLQLSSFQDRDEAETFLSSVKAQGFQAQITQAEVEGKGTFYRVRMGTYRSMDAATSAKSELEKAGKSASIMKL